MQSIFEGLGRDLAVLLTIGGFLLTLFAVLYFFVSEDRKRSQAVNRIENKIDRLQDSTNVTVDKLKDQVARVQEQNQSLLGQAGALIRDIHEIRAASGQIPPDFTALISNQWRLFDRMSRYRHEKRAICRQIVEKYISPGITVLLDSGSTTDQVTAELIAKGVANVTIYSNNLLSALHLTGTTVVRFSLLPGEFFHHSWAVYSDEANHRIDQLGVNVFILAAAAVRFSSGIMVRQGEDGNLNFKKKAIEIFQQRNDTRLIIAVDASKFSLTTKAHIPVVPQQQWQTLVRKFAQRIVLVTSHIPREIVVAERAAIAAQIEQFEAAGVVVDSVTPV